MWRGFAPDSVGSVCTSVAETPSSGASPLPHSNLHLDSWPCTYRYSPNHRPRPRLLPPGIAFFTCSIRDWPNWRCTSLIDQPGSGAAVSDMPVLAGAREDALGFGPGVREKASQGYLLTEHGPMWRGLPDSGGSVCTSVADTPSSGASPLPRPMLHLDSWPCTYRYSPDHRPRPRLLPPRNRLLHLLNPRLAELPLHFADRPAGS